MNDVIERKARHTLHDAMATLQEAKRLGEALCALALDDFAAAAAAATSGAGKTKNRMLINPLTPSTAFSIAGIGTKPGAGSSKYMILTISR